jgi:YHS domain-containing protein
LTLDPVELVAGREVQGDPSIALTHHVYTYRFANEENRAAFRDDRERFEIQMGGACGGMGPLSGEGTTDIWAVHGGRIYIFASEGCRRRFLAAPEDWIEPHEPAPACTDEARERGARLLDLAVKALGGAERLDAVRTYRERLARDTKSGDRVYRHVETLTLRLPGGLRHVNCWVEHCWAMTADGESAWAQNADGVEPLHDQNRIALVRAQRHPLRILSTRREPGFVACSTGMRECIAAPGEGEIEVELLTVWFDGAATVLGVEPQTGRIRLMRFRGRGLSAAVGETEKIYGAFHDVGGLTLPGAVLLRFNGKDREDASGTFDVQAINDPSDESAFTRPTQPG